MPRSFPFSFPQEAFSTPRSPFSHGFLSPSYCFFTPIFLAPSPSSPSSRCFCSLLLAHLHKSTRNPSTEGLPQKYARWLLASCLSRYVLHSATLWLSRSHLCPPQAAIISLESRLHLLCSLGLYLASILPTPSPPTTAQLIYGGPAAPVSFHLNHLHIQGD